MSNNFKNVSEQRLSLRYAWYTVALFMLANISSFLDMQILALLVGNIKRDAAQENNEPENDSR